VSLSDEQKKLRATGLGASEIASIVGVGPGKLIDVWESKVSQRPAEDLDDMLPAELGVLLEQPVADVYARRTGTLLAPTATFRHPTRPLILATPDRARFTSEAALQAARAFGLDVHGQLSHPDALSHADRLLEVKTHAARYRRDYGREGSGSVPEHEAIQTIVQMGVTGQRTVDLAVLFRGDFSVKLEVFTVAWNSDLFEALAEAAERFWTDHVLTRKPPPPDASDAYSEVLGRIHPTVTKPHAVADADDEELMLRYSKFSEVARRADHLKKLTGQRLMARVGDAGGLSSTSLGKLSWVHVRDRMDVDWRQAANNALELAGLCLQGFDKLAAVGEQITPENRAQLEARLKEIVPLASKPAGGYRYLRMYPKGEAALELARLEIALDALTDGT
jgi:putative phage-type endonuclease